MLEWINFIKLLSHPSCPPLHPCLSWTSAPSPPGPENEIMSLFQGPWVALAHVAIKLDSGVEQGFVASVT